MSYTDEGDAFSGNSDEQWMCKEGMSRADIVEKFAEEETSAQGQKKALVIEEKPADAVEIAQNLGIQTDSSGFSILKIYCDEKKCSESQARTFAQRVVSSSEEYNNFLKRLCENSQFSAQNIMDLMPSVKKLSGKRLLLLHGFTELKGFDPGHLNRFFLATLPQIDQRTATREALELEKQEKAMTSVQIDLFYNICLKLPDLDADTALTVLPKLRMLKEQHARILNLFLGKDTCFDNKPITNKNLPGLIKLWAGLPEIEHKELFEKLIKKLSHQSDEKKHDFKFLTQAFKNEVTKETEPHSKIGNVFRHLMH